MSVLTVQLYVYDLLHIQLTTCNRVYGQCVNLVEQALLCVCYVCVCVLKLLGLVTPVLDALAYADER